MTNAIQHVIQCENEWNRPQGASAKHARPECQPPAENAADANLGAPDAALDAGATAAKPLPADAADHDAGYFRAYLPCKPMQHTQDCLRVYGNCIYKPVPVKQHTSLLDRFPVARLEACCASCWELLTVCTCEVKVIPL